MSRQLGVLIAAGLVWVSVGCGGGMTPQVRYGGTVAVTLVNDAGRAACYVRMSPTFDGEWGEDWLGEAETIAVGAERTFTIAPQSQWDIRVEDCDHEVISERFAIPATAPMRLGVQSLQQVSTPFVPGQPPPPLPPGSAACNVGGTWAWNGTDNAGTQWSWTLTLTQNGNALDGAFQWRASTGNGGTERVRGTIDCTTHAFSVTGYALENATGLIQGTYRGTIGPDWRTVQGSWGEGVPGSFWGARQ